MFDLLRIMYQEYLDEPLIIASKQQNNDLKQITKTQ